MAEEARLLRQRIERHEATVAIIGLGYVGLPLADPLRRGRLPGPRLRRRRGEGRAC